MSNTRILQGYVCDWIPVIHPPPQVEINPTAGPPFNI